MASQQERNKVAIRTILKQMGETSYPEIALRGGEGLASPLMQMVRDGEVVRTVVEGAPSTYRLAS